jgi:hypothetical protein
LRVIFLLAAAVTAPSIAGASGVLDVAHFLSFCGQSLQIGRLELPQVLDLHGSRIVRHLGLFPAFLSVKHHVLDKHL